MADKNIKFDIENGEAFFADELGVIHNPLRIIIDFRSVTPRIDVRNNDFQPIVLKHNVVMMDPFRAKNLLELLQKNIANYEKKFGEIQMPEALKQAEGQQKKGKEDTSTPVYFG